MKIKSAVLFFWAFLISGCVLGFAQQKTYLSLNKGHLTQSDKPLSASLEFDDLSKTAYYVESLLVDYEGDLYFDSDIDLGQIDADGNCKVNHTPLTFKKKGGAIYGNGHEIKNMCATLFVKDNFTDYGMRRDTLGFFKVLDGVTVKNLKFRNVNFSVTEGDEHSDKLANGTLYAPVGSLAGIILNSTIDSVFLTSVNITSPISGGVAGFAEESNFSHVFSTDQITIRNQSLINKVARYAGSGGEGNVGGGQFSAYLGGLVGLSVNVGISDVDISVSAKNESSDTLVVLGGLVGQYSFLNKDASGKKNVVENVNVGKKEKSEFENGFVMGGLFGLVSKMKREGGNVDLDISNSGFYGSLKNVAGDSAFVGGFIAWNTMDDGTAIKIKDSYVELDIEDSMKNSKMNAYYAGGFIGYSTQIFNGSYLDYPDAFISIVGSKASGKIKLHNPSAAEKIRIFVGGFLGYGAMAMNDGALLRDTSLVDIDVNVKSVDKESTALGGFVGFLKNKSVTSDIAFVNVKKSLYSGSISVKNSANQTYVGGVAGFYNGCTKEHALNMENVFVSGTDLIYVSADESYVGGAVGYADASSTFDRIAVIGNIEVKDAKTSMLAGGIFGYIVNSKVDFSWTNSYYIGDIIKSGSVGSSVNPLIGYLAGSVSMSGVGLKHTIHSLYHSGSDNVGPFGQIANGTTPLADWENIDTKCDKNTLCWDVHHIARNGDAKSLNSRNNGVVTLDAIQSSYFVDFLNESNMVDLWMQDDNENGKYPFFDENAVVEFSSSSVVSSSSLVSSSSEIASSSSEIESSSSEISSSESSSSEIQIPGTSSSEVVYFESSSSVYESSSSVVIPFESSSSEDVSSSSEIQIPESSSLVVEIVVNNPSNEKKAWRWKMISLAQFENISLENDEALYWWNESSRVGEYLQYQSYDPNNKGEGTRGYWIWSDKDFSASAKVNSNVNASFVWNVDSLYSGWNLVANPYGWPVRLGNLPDDVQVWRWLDSKFDYDTVTVLNPYEGVWVHSGSRKSITIDATPVNANTVAALKKQSVDNSADWCVSFVLEDKFGRSDSRNIIGAGSKTEKWIEPPNGMSNDHVKLSIVDGKNRYAKLQKRSSDNLEWTFQMQASSDREGFLKLEGLETLAGSGKKLYVIDDGKVTEMKSGKSVRVALKSYSRNVSVMVSEKAPVFASKAIYDFHVSLDHQINVDFNVVKNYNSKSIDVMLVNALGSKVYSAKIPAGNLKHQVQLGVPQKGIYFLAVKVGNDVATRKIVIR